MDKIEHRDTFVFEYSTLLYVLYCATTLCIAKCLVAISFSIKHSLHAEAVEYHHFSWKFHSVCYDLVGPLKVYFLTVLLEWIP